MQALRIIDKILSGPVLLLILIAVCLVMLIFKNRD